MKVHSIFSLANRRMAREEMSKIWLYNIKTFEKDKSFRIRSVDYEDNNFAHLREVKWKVLDKLNICIDIFLCEFYAQSLRFALNLGRNVIKRILRENS